MSARRCIPPRIHNFSFLRNLSMSLGKKIGLTFLLWVLLWPAATWLLTLMLPKLLAEVGSMAGFVAALGFIWGWWSKAMKFGTAGGGRDAPPNPDTFRPYAGAWLVS